MGSVPFQAADGAFVPSAASCKVRCVPLLCYKASCEFCHCPYQTIYFEHEYCCKIFIKAFHLSCRSLRYLVCCEWVWGGAGSQTFVLCHWVFSGCSCMIEALSVKNAYTVYWVRTMQCKIFYLWPIRKRRANKNRTSFILPFNKRGHPATEMRYYCFQWSDVILNQGSSVSWQHFSSPNRHFKPAYFAAGCAFSPSAQFELQRIFCKQALKSCTGIGIAGIAFSANSACPDQGRVVNISTTKCQPGTVPLLLVQTTSCALKTWRLWQGAYYELMPSSD